MLTKLLIVTFLWLMVVGIYQSQKELPKNVSYSGEIFTVGEKDVIFLKDLTYLDETGNRVLEQQIFPEIFNMIDEAENYILLDLFLYNDFLGTENTSYRQLSGELTQKLIEKKQSHPEIIIQLITDPINTLYGGFVSKDFEALKEAGISVITTDLRQLRDSNVLYSPLWRTFFQWLGNNHQNGVLPNPMDQNSEKLTFRTYLALLNYKANHRKVVLTDRCEDEGCGLSALITSANPHDGSSAHSNAAIRVDSSLWRDVLKTEAAVADFSGYDFSYPPEEFISKVDKATTSEASLKAQLLTEGAIEQKILTTIDKTGDGDRIDMAMFYLSDRDVVKSLKKADERGVNIRLILDPNKDAFGRKKNGTPNRQVAHELFKNTEGNTKIRWCNTHGEQCHSKLLLVKTAEEMILIQGSANFTKRNIGDFNLETDVMVVGSGEEQIFKDVGNFFGQQWSNEDGIIYTTDYETFKDSNLNRTLIYRFKEFSGSSRW